MTPLYEAYGPEGLGVYSVEWRSDQPVFERVEGRADVLLVPGFVDTHIHGAHGIDFMTATSADLQSLIRRLKESGYEAFLPTTVSASYDEVAQALSALPVDSFMAGFHLEGPFLSPKYPGAQPPEAICDAPDPSSPWETVFQDPRLRIVSLAPEIPGAVGLIGRLVARGVAVSIAHTDSTFAQAQSAYRAGATRTTHTYNAMRGLHHREAGTVGFALLQEDLVCELIYDGVHVSKEAATVLIKCKGLDHVVAVSDASQAAGLSAGTELTMWGQRCVTDDHCVRLVSNGALAGSTATLLDCFRNLADDFGLEAAIRLCSLNPRRVAGRPSDPTTWIKMDRQLRIIEILER